MTNLISFLIQKVGSFSKLSVGEQVSFSSLGVGLVLILLALILFLL